MDLQIIDKGKQLDLLKYHMKKRRKYVTELSTEYHKMATKQEKKELQKKVENPLKKSACDIQNNIHAVEVQIREAVHIRNRYSDIKMSLKDDAAKFESRIKALEDELHNQNSDIEKLQKIMEEATIRRGKARGNLLREEKQASSAANQREGEAAQGRKLVSERKNELEKLEKRLFLIGKLPPRPVPEGAEADVEEDSLSPVPHPVEVKAQEFDLLKKATGGTSTQEVLERFQGQRETEQRLNELRTKSENEKRRLEKNLEALKNKLEGYKYSEVKEAEKKLGEMERLKNEIISQQGKSESFKQEKASKERALGQVLQDLHGLRLLANPLSIPSTHPDVVIEGIVNDIRFVVEKYDKYLILEHEKMEQREEENEEEEEKEPVLVQEENLPVPYSGLIRKTPLPQMAGSPSPAPPPGSEDEEEVPSRGYLKRQAQLVIDAKFRRKNVRIQLPKRN
ncbi:coiled-coil domain containing protein 151 isoform X2 [Rhynchophorus ferrugineus]